MSEASVWFGCNHVEVMGNGKIEERDHLRNHLAVLTRRDDDGVEAVVGL